MDSAETLARFEAAAIEYRGTIRTFARNCVRQLPSTEIEDVEQELLTVLWKCVQNYDPDRGASFSTLFQGSARNKIIGLVRHNNTLKRKGEYLLTSLDAEDVSAAIEGLRSEASAEDWFFAIAEHGPRLRREMARASA
jgi:DNA-directed RNA polymerase specialized sigma24 family protein